ncbi:ATP-binding protein [Quadrisphaera sp. KR29]|uniref:ATP-binding protein n=1 Tax=Quadrisphaera sp. KR29 TaxID=3461391 RepID=UPI004044802D
MTETVLPCGPEAAGQARRLVAQACTAAQLPPDACDSALLCTSELVTNAIVHGRSDVRLWVRTDPGWIRIEVGDDNSRHPHLQPADDGALDGRGLFIVDLLTTRWGVRDDSIGKVVWFELRADASAG